MKSIHKITRTFPLLLGVGAIACTMTDDGSAPEGTDEIVGSQTQQFNPGPETVAEPYKGHHEVTKKAILYLAQRGLLPATLATAANQNLVLYGNEFGDHSWLGRPEAPTTSVP